MAASFVLVWVSMGGLRAQSIAILIGAVTLAAANYMLNPRVAATVAAQGEIARTEPYLVGTAELAVRQPLLWVDARTDEAFANGHVAEAVHLPPQRFDDALAVLFERWEPEQTIVVYCDGAGCGASREVAMRLRQAFGTTLAEDAVVVFKGGWAALPPAWREGREP